MQNSNLVILTSAFPFFEGEYFIDDEIQYASSRFNKVTVICISKKTTDNNYLRQLPSNVEAHFIQLDKSKSFVFKNFISLFNIHVIKECFYIFFNNKRYKKTLMFKIMLNDYIEANCIKDIIVNNKSLTSINSNIFYSYWNDKTALSLVLLKKEFSSIKIVSRAHGWDVDKYRHEPQYLPFKKYLISKLDHIYCISENGVKLLKEYVENISKNNISVSRLGKLNDRKLNKSKNHEKLIVVSCSAIISLKRIHLIIDILSNIRLENIEWYHFGDGNLKEEISDYASKQIPFVSCHFMGIVRNNQILDFYAENYIDLFINVSETEGIPVSIMEAQSAGIPVLATNVGGTSEIVDSKNGFLIDKDFDVDTVANMITKYLMSDDEAVHEKRNYAYQNWKLNYNANINYTEFYKSINNQLY